MKSRFLLPLLAFFTIFSCKDNQTEPFNPESGKVRLSGTFTDIDGRRFNIGDTDTAGVYFSAPYDIVNNVAVPEGENSFRLAPPINLLTGDEESGCEISAYMPYDSSWGRKGGSYSVCTDQSDEKVFNASMFYIATKKFGAEDLKKTAELEFKPMLSRLVIKFANETSSHISEVRISGLQKTADISPAQYLITAAGEKTTFIACCPDESAMKYMVTVPPQKTALTVNVSLENGDEYSFDELRSVNLAGGKSWTNDEALVIKGEGPVDPEDFTKMSTAGIYGISSTEMRKLCTYRRGTDQYAFGSSKTGGTWRLQNPSEKWIVWLTTSATRYSVGAEVTVDLKYTGRNDIDDGIYKTEVEKVSDGKIWLKGQSYGFIINAEQ